MQNTYPSGPILKAGLEGACPVERCLPIPGFHRNGGMLNFCKVLSQLVSIPLLFIAVICVQSALLAPWRKCHLFTLVLISVFTVLAKTIHFIQLKSFLLQNWLLGRLYFLNLENQGQTIVQLVWTVLTLSIRIHDQISDFSLTFISQPCEHFDRMNIEKIRF